MKKIILSVLLFSQIATAKVIRVAVVDSGLDPKYNHVLCKEGSKDFTGFGLDDGDKRKHGTNIAGVINSFAGYPKASEFCIVVLKYYDERYVGNTTVLAVLAFREAVRLGVDVINFSSTGRTPNLYEKYILRAALKRGIKVFVPSGNEDLDLDKDCSVFPACYEELPGLTVVGRSDIIGGAGRGKVVDVYENGGDVSGFGITQTGTSQATASACGKEIRRMLDAK